MKSLCFFPIWVNSFAMLQYKYEAEQISGKYLLQMHNQWILCSQRKSYNNGQAKYMRWLLKPKWKASAKTEQCGKYSMTDTTMASDFITK